MSLPSLFEICSPRRDVREGAVGESDFAADLAQVVLTGRNGSGSGNEYTDPEKFFSNTHPTRGLKDLLHNVYLRLRGSPEQISPIFRLDTQYGGGKTHALIALVHAARGMVGVSNAHEFIDPALVLPPGTVNVAAYDGENADPANGRSMGDGIRAFTPWGELAYALAGPGGYMRVQASDQAGVAPGAETLRELFGERPCLILIDELSIYLRKLSAKDRDKAGRQLTAFLTSLFKAVEGTPNSVVVYTLAIGKEGKAVDAYSEENQFIADRMEELEQGSARKATLLDPTEEDETVKVLRRRLFEYVNDEQAEQVILAYKTLWDNHRDVLPSPGGQDMRMEVFRNGYPLHPELIETLTNKTSTLGQFQRVRGMLRLLARTVGKLWQQQGSDAYAIHLHHIDPGFEPIRQEILTRLGQRQFISALRGDVASSPGEPLSLAQNIDMEIYRGMPPYCSYVARSIFVHTLAFNENLKGLTPEELRYSLVSPSTDISFIDDARKRFVADSAYLDDRPTAPLRFLAEANLNVILRRQEAQVDLEEARTELNDRIRQIFSGKILKMLPPFPGAPYDVDDDIGDGLPQLVVIGYDADSVPAEEVRVPELVSRIYQFKGSGHDLRLLRNNLVFVVADEGRKDEMRQKMKRRLALRDLRSPDRLGQLAEYQQERIQEWFQRSEQEVALAIQQCYRHVFYPSRNRVEGAQVDLAHSAIEVQSASDRPGDGQQQVVRILRDNNKLRLGEDHPDSPTYIRDRTPLRKGQITTLELRNEFRKDPGLPMLIGDELFVRGIRQGIEQGEYVYKSGELLYGQGDPFAEVKIDSQSVVMTMASAREQGIWPRRVEPAPQPSGGQGGVQTPEPEDAGSDDGEQLEVNHPQMDQLLVSFV
jgi:hypothetical protein